MTRGRSIVLLAVVYTLCNAVKPLQIDDGAYVAFAHQDAAHPLDPYGFAMFWWYVPEPANHVLAPPLLPYWWACGIRLFGERPWLWKLWLLPFALLLATALMTLFRRFARGLETPLTWMTLLSPALFPSFNLMLDVPALALSLAAVTLFLAACDRDSVVLAASSGLVAALAIETKYTGFLAPAVVLLYAVLFRKLRLAAVVLLVVVHGVASWEFLMAMLYGESHFLYAAGRGGEWLDKLVLAAPLLTIMGAIAWPVFLLALAALGVHRAVAVFLAVAGFAGYALVAVLGETFRSAWDDAPLCQRITDLVGEPFEPEHVLYALSGTLISGGVVWVIARLCRVAPGARWFRVNRRVEWFLVLWLGLEIAGFFAMTPFVAVRRVLGILLVATLLAGRLASRTCRQQTRRSVVHGVALYSVVLGSGFYLLDLREAFAMQEAAEMGARWAQRQGTGTVWFVGHWSFQFYGERAGMKPVVPQYEPSEAAAEPGRAEIPLPPPSQLRKGDWVIVPDDGVHCQSIDYRGTEPVTELRCDDALPWRTVMCFYSGSRPLEHRAITKPRRSVEIRRVTVDYVP